MGISYRRWGLFLLVLLGVLVPGVWLAWSFAEPPPAGKPDDKGRPKAQVRVLGEQPSVVYRMQELPAEASLQAYRRYQRTQIGMLKSRSVANMALQQPRIRTLALVRRQKDPVAWILDHLQARFLEESEIMEVWLDGGEPKDAADLVNAIVGAYLDSVVGREQKVRESRQEQLKDLGKTYAALIKERRAVLQKLTAESGANVLKAQLATSVSEKLRLMQSELRLEEAEARTLLGRRKAQADAGTESVRKEIAQIEDRLAVLKARRDALAEELSPAPAAVSQPVHDLSDFQAELKHMEETAEQINREAEILRIELNAPPRIVLLERAAPPIPEKDQP